MNIVNLIGNYIEFLDIVFDNLVNAKIDVSKYDLDHIAYRAVTLESYQEISNKLLSYAKIVHQKIIRNRPVDIYLLNESLVYKDREVDYFEVLAPAEGDRFKEGLEHCEFVLTDIGLHDFAIKYNHLRLNLDSIDREIGSEVGVLFENGANVKFKNQTMKQIIDLEKRLM